MKGCITKQGKDTTLIIQHLFISYTYACIYGIFYQNSPRVLLISQITPPPQIFF